MQKNSVSAMELRTKIYANVRLSMRELQLTDTLQANNLSREQYDKMAQSGKQRHLIAMRAWASQASRDFGDDDRLVFASHFVQQALDRSDVCYVRWDSPWAVRLYYLHSRSFFRTLVLAAAWALCLLVVWEPAQTWRATSSAGVLGAEGALLLILGSNQLLPLLYMGGSFFDRWERTGEAALLGLLTVDFVVGVAAAVHDTPIVRFARPLRGFLVFFLIRSVQHCVSAATRTLPALGDLLFLLALVVVTSALFAASLFNDDGEKSEAPDGSDDVRPARAEPALSHAPGAAPGEAFSCRRPQVFFDSFHTFADSALALVSLWSTDNYPTVMALPCRQSVWCDGQTRTRNLLTARLLACAASERWHLAAGSASWSTFPHVAGMSPSSYSSSG